MCIRIGVFFKGAGNIVEGEILQAWYPNEGGNGGGDRRLLQLTVGKGVITVGGQGVF